MLRLKYVFYLEFKTNLPCMYNDQSRSLNVTRLTFLRILPGRQFSLFFSLPACFPVCQRSFAKGYTLDGNLLSLVGWLENSRTFFDSFVVGGFTRRTTTNRKNTSNQNLGPVVQSIVSFTSSLRVKMLTVPVSTISNSLVFAEKNVSSKSYSHFFSAKILVYMP